MGLQKITFDGANVSAKHDADLQHFLFSHEVGILPLKKSVSFTLSNNTITFQDGYVAIFGRLIYVESNTQIAVSADSNKYGFVILKTDTISNQISLELKEASGAYPSLTQDCLVDADGVYEFVLCAYNKTTTSVSIDVNYKRAFIKSVDTKILELRNEIKSSGWPKEFGTTRISNGVYRITGVSSEMLMRSMIYIIVGFNRVVSLPGILLFQGISSAFSVSYEYSSTTYSMYLSYVGGNLTMTCSSTSHTISKVIIFEH